MALNDWVSDMNAIHTPTISLTYTCMRIYFAAFKLNLFWALAKWKSRTAWLKDMAADMIFSPNLCFSQNLVFSTFLRLTLPKVGINRNLQKIIIPSNNNFTLCTRYFIRTWVRSLSSPLNQFLTNHSLMLLRLEQCDPAWWRYKQISTSCLHKWVEKSKLR